MDYVTPQRKSRRESVELCVAVELARELERSVDGAGERKVQLPVAIETGTFRTADQKVGAVEVEMDVGDIFAGQESEGMVDAATSQSIFYASSRNRCGVAERERGNVIGLFANADLEAQRAIAEARYGRTVGGLPNVGIRVPAEFDVAQHPKLQQAADGGLADVVFGPDAIPTVFEFEDSVLGDIGRIGDRGTIGIRDDGVRITARLLADPLRNGQRGKQPDGREG